jgi:hypothetical protein
MLTATDSGSVLVLIALGALALMSFVAGFKNNQD